MKSIKVSGATMADLDALVAAAQRRPLDRPHIDSEITEYEKRHGMTTAELRRRFRGGTIEESPDIVRWLMLDRLRRPGKPLSPTTPIENVIDATDFLGAYMRLSDSFGRPRNLVAIHKQQLGKQTTTMQVGEHRLWVWVRPTWTVFVGNAKGICFEVPEGTDVNRAWIAWQNYRQAVCIHCGGSGLVCGGELILPESETPPMYGIRSCEVCQP